VNYPFFFSKDLRGQVLLCYRRDIGAAVLPRLKIPSHGQCSLPACTACRVRWEAHRELHGANNVVGFHPSRYNPSSGSSFGCRQVEALCYPELWADGPLVLEVVPWEGM